MKQFSKIFFFFKPRFLEQITELKKVKGGLTEETSMYNSQHKGKFEYLCLPVYKLSFSFFDSLVVSWASVLQWGTQFSSSKKQKPDSILDGKIQFLLYDKNSLLILPSTR